MAAPLYPPCPPEVWADEPWLRGWYEHEWLCWSEDVAEEATELGFEDWLISKAERAAEEQMSRWC